MESSTRSGPAEATLGAFTHPMRTLLVPLLFYKSHFLGDWFTALTRQELEPEARAALGLISRDTLREAIEAIHVAQEWERTRPPVEQIEALAAIVQRRALDDMLAIKEGNAEVMMLAAMQAPTPALRDRLARLADADRSHADHLRGLLGLRTLDEKLHRERVRPEDGPLGAHQGREPGKTLGGTIQAALDRLPPETAIANRLVLSPVALRHLRDEGHVSGDGRALGLATEIDFGWEGECFAIETAERVSLAEIIARDGSRSA